VTYPEKLNSRREKRKKRNKKRLSEAGDGLGRTGRRVRLAARKTGSLGCAEEEQNKRTRKKDQVIAILEKT